MSSYYVDTSGSDANSGLSAILPWQTIAKVNASTFSAGDFILFNKGQTWRETLTVPSSGSSGNPITFGAYGSGADPIISGSNLVTTWTEYTGSVWQATVTTAPSIVYFNGTRGTLVANAAAITAEFQWYWAANVLYVYAPSGDPAAHYTAPGIEAGARSNPLATNNKIWITLDGLTIRDGNGNFGNINVGSTTVTGVVIQNSTIERSGGDGIDLKGTSTADSVTLNNCTIQNNGGWGIWVNNAYVAGKISNSIVTGNGIDSVKNAQQYSGIQGYLGNFNIFGNTIYANVANGQGGVGFSHGIYGLLTTAVANIYQNTIYSHAMGNGIKLTGSANVYRNLIYGNATAGITAGQNSSTNVVYSIYYNVIYSNNTGDVSNGIDEQTKGAGTLSLTIENNLVYQNGNTTQQEIKIADNLTVLTIKNNLLYATSTRRTVWALAQTGTVSINNNLHWRADGNPNIFYNGAGATWAQWQALGFDTQGLNVDPLLVAPTTDFHLQAGSPCINAGVDVGLTADYEGRGISGLPDIGAYEFRAGYPHNMGHRPAPFRPGLAR